MPSCSSRDLAILLDQGAGPVAHRRGHRHGARGLSPRVPHEHAFDRRPTCRRPAAHPAAGSGASPRPAGPAWDPRALLGSADGSSPAAGHRARRRSPPVATAPGPLFAKSVYGAGLDWLALLYWRFLLAGLLVWAWAILVPANRAGLRALPRRRVVALLGLGAFFVGNAGTYYASLQYISASLASLIVYIYPALVAVLSIRFGHGLHGRRPWAALGIVSVGVALTLGGIETHAEPIGLVLAVASPCIYAVYIVLAARLAGERRGETANDRTGGDGAETRPAVAAVADAQRDVRGGGAAGGRDRRADRPVAGARQRLVRPGRDRGLLDGGRDVRLLRRGGADRRGAGGARLHGGAALDDHARDAHVRGAPRPRCSWSAGLSSSGRDRGPDNARERRPEAVVEEA